jgi:hypothetical protein
MSEALERLSVVPDISPEETVEQQNTRIFDEVLQEMGLRPASSGIAFVHVLRAMKLTAEKIRGEI